ncbi:MAG TPA: phosphoribosylanthranilate isomerase [Burkholderiales bacterium]|nr:phosphoribosylanthranilate isomerase [Burkholderiales bacterium]
MATAVKICGITRSEDGLSAARHGAHAIGLVFYHASPRYVEPAAAAAIMRVLPPFVMPVGLFVDAPVDFVREALSRAPVQLLQFHGSETPAYCRAFGVPYIKAVRMSEAVDLVQYARDYADAKGLLLDASVPGFHGGTGARFDWTLVPSTLSLPIVLSGGLDAANVGEAIRRVRPWAVDVSSGVEAAKGIKDPAKIAAFIAGVRNADV